MSASPEITGLIERLERATGPDRELDRVIDEFDVRSRGKIAPDKPFCVEGSPEFTASLDAALTLLPEGHGARLYSETLFPGYSAASVAPRGEHGWVAEEATHIGMDKRPAAIALCLAALKSRARA